MRLGGMLGIVMAGLVSACAIEGVEGEQIDEAEQALPFSLSERGQVGPTSFNVSQGGNVMVTVTGLHLNPRGCSKVKGANLILTRRGTPPVNLSPRQLAPDGKKKFETWNNLPAGTYELSIDPIGQNPLCSWVGDVFVEAR